MAIQRRAKTSTKAGTKISNKDAMQSKDDAIPKGKKIQINFKADPEIFLKLKTLADKDSRTLSSLMIKIIKDYLAIH